MVMQDSIIKEVFEPLHNIQMIWRNCSDSQTAGKMAFAIVDVVLVEH